MSKCAYCKQEKGKLSIKSVDVCTSCNAHGRDYDTLKAKAELFKDLIDCIDNLIADKAHMPSVEHLLKEAKEL